MKGDGAYAHADWAEAEVELADGTTVRLTGGGAFSTETLADDLLPFSLQYGGRPAAELIPGWKKTTRTIQSQADVTTREITWRDPETGLECVLEMQTFAHFPAVEWVMRFRNTGKQDTPLIENIRPLDMEWVPDDQSLLRRSYGSLCRSSDFQYRIDPLATGETIAMAAGGGRSSNAWLPFFNLQTGRNGVIIGIGWSGPSDSYSPDEFTGDWAKHVGNWSINPAAHPNGLRPISDAAKAAGMKFLLWFEPERAVNGTPLTVEHPDWFLGERKPGHNMLFNLGLPEARRWLTDTLSEFMAEQGVQLYRQDFNFDPLPYWRAADAPDRQGMTEIRHVEGLYDFWDELLRRQPGLVIDNCASGGRRIDLETISRSIPLWRSDWQCGWINDGTPGQTHTMGLSYWVPLSGTGVLAGCRRAGDTYNFRSSLSAAISFGIFPYESFPIEEQYPWDWHRRMLADFVRARPLFYGDYYPLVANSPDYDVWAAFQMHRPDLGEGLVLAFRRKDAPFISADFRLQGLDPAAEYELQDVDTGKTWKQSSKELCERGVRVTLERAPESRLVFYRKQ